MSRETFEIVHRANAAGDRCALCGRRIVAEESNHRYARGAFVAVTDRQTAGSWRTQRKPTCPALPARREDP